MTSKIFISYRRGDDPGFTQALYAELAKAFPAAELFMDIQGHIKPGDVFAEVLDRHVRSCDVMLAVIGPRWQELLANHPEGEEDYVLREIALALALEKRVVPVTVGGARLPKPKDLPQPIRALPARHAHDLRPGRFTADAGDLVAYLTEALSGRPDPAPPKPPGEDRRGWPRAALALGAVAVLAVGALLAWPMLPEWLAPGTDYQSCVEETSYVWEEIRKCAIAYKFPL